MEEKIENMILGRKEVKAKDAYVRKVSGGTRHLSVVIYDKPSKQRNSYWVKVWEDNGSAYATYFNYDVDAKSLKVTKW